MKLRVKNLDLFFYLRKNRFLIKAVKFMIISELIQLLNNFSNFYTIFNLGF